MKVLVATHITQGDDIGDYCATVEGELVTPAIPPCRDRLCGCARGFTGLGSAHGTTTAIVADLAHIDEHLLSNSVLDFLRRTGRFDGLSTSAQYTLIMDHTYAIIRAAKDHPIGTVVCRTGKSIFVRESLAA
ncbi:MAG: hypothetical protein JWL72_892 [Ilumatobacteraceae bacterium]|nr:hypothetical protein [Ilumatobacteraceae bacterium]